MTGQTELTNSRTPTFISRAAISCWLVVEDRKLLIWLFSGSSTSTSMSKHAVFFWSLGSTLPTRNRLFNFVLHLIERSEGVKAARVRT